MNIMIVCGGFFPAQKHGGPVISIDNFVTLLKEHDFYIVTSSHDWKEKDRLKDIKHGWNQYLQNCKVLYLEDEQFNIALYRSIIKNIKPDIIYTNCFFLAKMQIPILLAARIEKVKILDAPRGAICRNPLRINWLKKSLYIKLIKVLLSQRYAFFQSTSEEETEQIKELLKVEKTHIFELPNIPSTPKKSASTKMKNTETLNLCFFSRICEKKNLLYAIKSLKNVHCKIYFNIYGTKEDNDYWVICEDEIKKLPSNITVNYMGSYRHDKVFELMMNNDLFYLPTLSENYGHVIIEALMSGLPILISDQTPWNDVEEYGCGWAFPLNNIMAFSKKIDEIGCLSKDRFNELKENAKKYAHIKADINTIHSEYNNMLSTIYNNE